MDEYEQYFDEMERANRRPLPFDEWKDRQEGEPHVQRLRFGTFEEQMQRIEALIEFVSPEAIAERRNQEVLEALCGPWGQV